MISRSLPRAVVGLHLWLERDGDTLFGMGRLQLLERIESTGSLKKAAEDLGMSYRAAWGKLKKSEDALGFKLVEHKRGGTSAGYGLTAEGRRLAEAFRRWYAEVERLALFHAKLIISPEIQEFKRQAEAKSGSREGQTLTHPGPLRAW